MGRFKEFLDIKERQAIKHLRVLGDLLESSGFKVKDYTNNTFENAYLYVYNPFKNTSFDGIRIYTIGENVVYRIQREHDTHPYGSAYDLHVETIYEDLVEDSEKNKKVEEEVLKVVANEIRSFFKESARAEKANEREDLEGDGSLGSVYIRNPLGGDYSNMVTDKTR